MQSIAKSAIFKGSYIIGPGAGKLTEKQKETHKGYSELTPAKIAEYTEKFLADLAQAKRDILAGRVPCVPYHTTNRKLDGIYTTNTLPIYTCTGICGKCVAGCYAVAILGFRQNARAIAAHNTAVLELDRGAFFKGIEDYCKTASEYRYHGYGEVVDLDYLARIVSVANNCPGCDFLLYTKRHNELQKYAGIIRYTKNLHVVASCMDRADIEKARTIGVPLTVVDYSHNGVPAKYRRPFSCPDDLQVYNCKSDCEACHAEKIGCWDKEKSHITVFPAH